MSKESKNWILVFDMDDTLYPELTYVHSGFQKVAGALEKEFGINAKGAFTFMKQALKNGRGSIFNQILELNGLYSKTRVKNLIRVYREHTPVLKLHYDAKKALKRLETFRKYIVTDGHKGVQARKVKALNLERLVDFVYITHRYGVAHAKPSPYCFLQIAKNEKVDPKNIVYFGDNPTKDFLGIRKLGFKTVRIHRGNYKDIKVPKINDAQYHIDSFNEVTESFLNKVFE